MGGKYERNNCRIEIDQKKIISFDELKMMNEEIIKEQKNEYTSN